MAAQIREDALVSTSTFASAVRPTELPARRTRRLAGSLELWLPAGFLVFMVLACFLWPVVHKLPSPLFGNLDAENLRPSLHHLFGTDPLGNDVFSRILYGGRISLEVGVGSVAAGLIIGGTIGATAGYVGGVVDAILMRCLDTIHAFPSLILATVVATFLGPSELHVIWAISFFSIPAYGRLARANTLPLREQTFVVASRISGARSWKLLRRHIMPNILPKLMTFGLLGIGIAIMVEAALSFLGLGVPPPAPSWGNMINIGQQNLNSDPELLLIPSAFLFATVMSLNLLGDALRARWSS